MKHWSIQTRLHGAITQKALNFILAAVRTWNLIQYCRSCRDFYCYETTCIQNFTKHRRSQVHMGFSVSIQQDYTTLMGYVLPSITLQQTRGYPSVPTNLGTCITYLTRRKSFVRILNDSVRCKGRINKQAIKVIILRTHTALIDSTC
jgi:hypothetical protein